MRTILLAKVHESLVLKISQLGKRSSCKLTVHRALTAGEVVKVRRLLARDDVDPVEIGRLGPNSWLAKFISKRLLEFLFCISKELLIDEVHS